MKPTENYRNMAKWVTIVASLYFFSVVGLYVNYNYVSAPTDWIYVALLIIIGGVSFALYRVFQQFKVIPRRQFSNTVGIAAFIFYGWIVLLFISVLLLIFYTHGFNWNDSITLAFNSITVLFVYAVMIVAWYISGRRFYQLLHVDIRNPLGAFIFALVLGQVGTIIFFYGATIFGFPNYFALCIYWLICLGIGYRALPECWYGIRKRILLGFSFQKQSELNLKTFLFVTLLVYTIVGFISASAGRPLDPDSVKAYAYIPYQIIQSGSLVDFMHSPLNNSAFASSYLYLPFMLFGPQYLNYINILLLWLLMGTVYYFAQAHLTKRAAYLACFLFLTMDFVFMFLTTVKTDFLLTLIFMWSIILLLRYETIRTRSLLGISGALFGVAVAIKYNALLALPGILAYCTARKKMTLQNFYDAIYFVGAAILAFLPWGLRSLIQFHNVLYPFTIFGKRTVTSQAAQILEKKFWLELSSYTHLLKENNSVFYNLYLMATNKTNYAYNKVGPLLFGLLPLTVFFRSLPAQIKRLSIIIIMTAVMWYLTSVRQVWYMLYILPLVWIVIAALWDKVKSRAVNLGISLVIIVLLVSNIRTLHLNLVTTLYAGNYAPAYLFNDHSVERYIETTIAPRVPSYRILPFGDIDTFSIENSYRHVIDNDFFIYWIPIIAEQEDPKAIVEELQMRGITHIFYDKNIIGSLEMTPCDHTPCPTVKSMAEAFRKVTSLLSVLHEADNWILYEI